MVKPKIRCPSCGSSQAYIRIKTGQIVCRECATITAGKGEIKQLPNREGTWNPQS